MGGIGNAPIDMEEGRCHNGFDRFFEEAALARLIF